MPSLKRFVLALILMAAPGMFAGCAGMPGMPDVAGVIQAGVETRVELIAELTELEDRIDGLEAEEAGLDLRVALGEITEEEAASERARLEALTGVLDVEHEAKAAELAKLATDVQRAVDDTKETLEETHGLLQQIWSALTRGDVLTALSLLAMLMWKLRKLGVRLGLAEEDIGSRPDRGETVSASVARTIARREIAGERERQQAVQASQAAGSATADTSAAADGAAGD